MGQCAALRRLAAEHRRAEEAAHRFREAAASPHPLEEETRRFLRVWRHVVVPHHRKEEEVLLPDLARRIPEGDALILLPLADHVVLRRLVREIERSPEPRRRELADELVERLAEHTRFEEESLYPALEETLGRARLTEIAGELRQHDGRAPDG